MARGEQVELTPLREAFIASGISPSELARRLGWMRRKDGRVYPDDTRVKQALGILRHRSGGRASKHYLRQRCSVDRAVELAEAIGVDPYEVGL